MAANYDVYGSYRTIRVYGPTSVTEVEFVTALTKPTGIMFSLPIALSTWEADQGAEELHLISQLLEDLATSDHVTGGSPSQDVDNSGLLIDYVDLTVAYDQSAQGLPTLYGVSQQKINEVSFWATDPSLASQSGLPTPAELVGQEYDRLKAIAGG